MINVVSLFSGIGAFEKALDRLNIPYNLVNYCEIDKYASKSYAQVHNVSEDLNLWDVTKIDTSKLKDIDLITYGFPCQDISLAGKLKGFEDNGEQTRSGLFFDALRVIEDTKPKIAIAENVKNLTGKRFKNEFQTVLNSLDEAGYNNYWKIMNAKDFGIPQNRERVFIVSIRKDIDTSMFTFPLPFKLELKLKDMLDEVVDDKYYLSEKMIKGFTVHSERHKEKGTGFLWKPKTTDDIANCLRANAALAPTDNSIIVEPKRLGGIFDDDKGKHQAGSVWDKDKISPTIDTMQGGYRQPCIVVSEATKKGYTEACEGDSVNISYPTSKTRRGRVGKQVAQTLTTSGSLGIVIGDMKIRRLTPLECWRLMGFDDEDFYQAEQVNSDTQLYKQAGNSIVVDVLEYLFEAIIESEVLNVKKVDEVKTITFECDDLLNVAALKEKEPELYEELLKDYPCENATYVFKNKRDVA